MRITKEAIENLRRQHDVVEVVRSRGVELTRKGRSYVGLCPFHEDHTPSLVVNPDKQLWNCLGACGANGAKSGGDVFTFVAKADGVTFVEALRRMGYEEPPAAPGKARLRGTAPDNRHAALSDAPGACPAVIPGTETAYPKRRDLLQLVVAHYHRIFREKPEGQDYLRRRGLTEPEMFTAFQVGYADGSLVKMLDADTAGALTEIGVLTAAGRELLLGCVVFPLTLPELGVVGLYGRHVRRDQHLYLPGPRRGVFHWQAMKGSQEVILAEATIDALTLFQAGLRNVSAVYGTQGFTADHERLLQRFRVRRVLLCLDNDDAGTKATEAIGAKIRKLGIDVADARVAGAKDTNALLVKVGPAATTAAIRKALDEARHHLEGPSPGPPPLTAAAKETSLSGLPMTAAVAPALRPGGPAISGVEGQEGGWRITFPARFYRVRGLTPNGLDHLKVNVRVDGPQGMYVETLNLYSQHSRSIFTRAAAQELGAKEEDLTREINVLIEVLERLRLDLPKHADHESGSVEISARERESALQALLSPDLMDLILADFERVGFVGEKTALSVGYLATVSRLLEEPLGVFTVSRSGAGKSSLQDAVCAFVPEEYLAKYTRVTGQALFYGETESLVHKVLAVDEERGAAEASYSLRVLQSAQELSIVTTETDPQTGKHRAHPHKVKGPTAIFLTTAARDALDYETRNRFVQLGIDETAEQTRRILERQRQMDTLEGVLARQEAEAIRRNHHNMQRLLRPLKVVNPYAHLLSYPDQRLQMRREQKKYLTLIKAIALLHQHQRQMKRERRGEVEIEYVEVIPSDITLANRLARDVLGHGLDDLAPPTRDLLRQIVSLAAVNGRRFTREDVTRKTGWPYSSVREHLSHLVDLEYVVILSGGNGRRITYELLFDGDPNEDQRYLAGLVDVEELLARRQTAVGSK
jgi:DNA primase